MRCPATAIDWPARSPPWRDPACPAEGEMVVTLGESDDQLQVVAAVQRQFDNPLVLDHGAHRGVLRLQLGGGPDHLDGFGDLSEGKREIEAHGLLHLHFHLVAGRALEAGFLHADVIGSRLQGREGIDACVRGDRATAGVGVDVGDGDRWRRRRVRRWRP